MPNFPLRMLFEIIAAAALALILYQWILGRFAVSFLVVYGIYYVLKLVLTVSLPTRKLVASLLFLSLTVAAAILSTCFEFEVTSLVDLGSADFGWMLLIWFPAWFVVPLLTFGYDMSTEKPRSIHWLVRRTEIELLVICPATYFVVGAIAISIAMPY